MDAFITDVNAVNALVGIAAMQAMNGVRSEGTARSQFVIERMEHYRRFAISDAEVRRLALEDLRTRF